MRFENLHDYNGHSNYAVVNENIEVWDEVLSDVSGVEKAASILSGGEVAFYNVLPKVGKQLDCIDHSLASMWYAIGKYHIIEKLGAEKAHQLFCTASQRFDRDHRSPTYGRVKKDGAYWDCLKLFDAANDKLPTKRLGVYHRDLSILPTVYQYVPVEKLKEFRANRTKVNILHGDLTDLIERGPYDFLYLSNALEYVGRNGDKFPIKDMVKKGGYIALTAGHSFEMRGLPRHVSDRIILKQKRAGRPSDGLKYGMSWNYFLLKNTRDPKYRVPKPLAPRLYSPYNDPFSAPPLYSK